MGPESPLCSYLGVLKSRTILYEFNVSHVADGMKSVGTHLHLVTGVCEKRYHQQRGKLVCNPLPVLVNVEVKETGTSKPSEKMYHFR